MSKSQPRFATYDVSMLSGEWQVARPYQISVQLSIIRLDGQVTRRGNPRPSKAAGLMAMGTHAPRCL